jgi:energy-coupling factor transport system ATP-binding protein
VIVHEPDILILDEPLVGLDREGKTDLLGIVEKWKTLGKTVILISHDIETVMNHVDRVVVLEKGKKVFDGTRIEFLEEYDPRFFTSKMLIMRKLVLKGEYPFSMSDDELLERVCNS